ncbi:MAG TPA: response regulator [Kofleriaceae bacterium]
MHLLLVDDNSDFAITLKTGLELRGHHVAVGHDAPTALLAARATLPDVALLDIGLPVVDGYELKSRLEKIGVTRFIAVSGTAEPRRSAELGFEKHFIKPVDLDALDRTLRGV